MTNKIVLASAGSGKTNYIIERSLEDPSRRICVTTYTEANTQEIKDRLVDRVGLIPPHITVITWFEFLLNHGLRPYISKVAGISRVESLDFNTKPPKYSKRSDIARYFFADQSNAYACRASDLTCLINDKYGGCVLERLEGLYDEILIDEVQDLAGYDLDLIHQILKSQIELVAVGDPRQTTYLTNHSQRNIQFRKENIVAWFELRASEGICEVDRLDLNYRCNQEICDFADALYPHLPATRSMQLDDVDHSGVFLVHHDDVQKYCIDYSPITLRYNRLTSTLGLPARNFGEVKGLTFDRVLIFPTRPMLDYLTTARPDQAGDIAKLYVAVTRARHSVAFAVTNDTFRSTLASRWMPQAASIDHRD